MPELPEVETIVRKLQGVLPGQIVKNVAILHPKTFHGNLEDVIGQEITAISRRAKIIHIHLASGNFLIVHLKMTGQLIYVDDQIKLGGGHPTADWVQELPSKHTRVVLEFESGAKLFFNDQRLFGWIKVVGVAELREMHAKLGPDVIDQAMTAEYLIAKLKNKSVPIKVAIMDNAIMCGLGNIYACDALNLARIHPQRPAKSLSPLEVTTLLDASKEILTKGIELGGTTFDGKYVDIGGFAGEYQSVVRVYGREGQECVYCQGEITKTTLGGRGTYFCVKCQQ